MCPPTHPSPVGEIGVYWSDDQIISFLDEYSQGSCLPHNVLEDSSPFLYPPENLPEGMWYLVESNAKEGSVFGFWKVKGEASKIYSDSLMIGWRTMLEYFEGEAPHGKITDWRMQEYTITQKELSDKNRIKESRSLCWLFISSTGEKHPNDCKTGIDPKQISFVPSDLPNTYTTSDQDCRNEAKDNKECGAELKSETDKKTNSPPGVFSEQDCFSRGDYLEMKDLEDDPESNSSSSQNSSCPSKLSDEYFDSLALLQDLEEDVNKYEQEKQSSSQYNFTSVRPNDVVLQPESVTCSIVQERLTEGTLLDQRHERERSRSEGSSIFTDVATSSTSTRNAMSDGEKKGSLGRKKKLKMYFCFMLF